MKRCPAPDWRKLGNMLTDFPKAVPEIPVSDVEKAAEYYVNVLGFSFDWGDDQGGIGGISQGQCRMFLTNAPFREQYGTAGSVMIWLNLDSKHEVDELYQRWREAGARILAEPEDKPWHLREFRVGDPDGNQLRVFYDFSWELRQEQASQLQSR
jgi:predicted lactoylglutathione lyase